MDFSTQKSYTMWRRTGLISFWEKFKSMSLPTNWMNYTFYNWHNEECWWLWWLILCTQLVRLWYPALLTTPKPLTVWITTNWKILQEMVIPDNLLTCLLRNLYACQEATVRTRLEQQTVSKLGKEYVKAIFFTLQNTKLEEAQTGIKIIGRNINDLRYADDTTLMAESKEELKSLLIKMKDSTFKKLRSRHPVPSLHGK